MTGSGLALRFLDTGVLLARLDRRDPRHALAAALYPGGPAVTTNLVCGEILTLALARRGDRFALALAGHLWSTPPLRVERVTEEDEVAARGFFARLAGTGATHVDCASFAVIERLGCPAALSFDRHFRLGGSFTAWP